MARCHPFLPSPSPVIRDDDYEVVVVDTISSCASSPTTEEAFLNTDPNIGADFVSKPTFSNPDLPCSANEKTCQDSDSFGNFRGSECSPNSNNTMLSNDFETIVCDSKFGRHPALLYRSIRFKGKIIEFIYNDKSRDGQTLYYVCAECQKLRRKIGPKLGPVARVRVVGGKFKDDPDRPRNPHYCNLKTIGEAMAVRVRYRMYKKIQDDVQRYESYSDSANVRNENVDAEKTSYEATVAETKYGRHPALLYRSVLHPGKVVEFVFSDKGNDGKTMYYVCAACLKLRRRDRRYGPPPRVRVINGRFRDNPDKPKVDHFCDFKTVAEALGQRERYRLYQSVRKTPKRPKLAFLDAVDEIYDRYDLSLEEKEDVRGNMLGPNGFSTMKRSITRATRYARRRQYCDNETLGNADVKTISSDETDRPCQLVYYEKKRSIGIQTEDGIFVTSAGESFS